MRRALCLCLVLFAVVAMAQQPDVVLIYPRLQPGQTEYPYAATIDSSFILGHVTDPAGHLLVNGTPVPLTADGAFLAWLPVRQVDGRGQWVLDVRRDGRSIGGVTLPYTVGAAHLVADTTPPLASPRVLRVTHPNAHLWTARDGTYIAFPDSGCLLLATQHEQGFYRVELGDDDALIEDGAVVPLADSTLAPATLGNGECTRIGHSTVCRFALSRSVPWRARSSDDGHTLWLTLFGVRSAIERLRFDSGDEFLESISWDQTAGNVVLRIQCSRGMRHGFSATFDGGDFVLRLNSAAVHPGKGLKRKVIVVDPGHGGSGLGAIGPRGTQEKDVNLKLGRLLKAELRKLGAEVLLTRTDDSTLGLYDRIEFARRHQADFFLSVHCNALPDSQNPLIRHGSGTYFYHDAARPAAERVHRHLLKGTGLRDDGLFYANLAAVRPTEFPAVLVETAYLINPDEELLLQSDEFLPRTARELARGVREYFQIEP